MNLSENENQKQNLKKSKLRYSQALGSNLDMCDVFMNKMEIEDEIQEMFERDLNYQIEENRNPKNDGKIMNKNM
jgi:hypothetical protein